MKYIWLGIAVIAIAGLVIWGNTTRSSQQEAPLPPESTTLVGPQEPLPTDIYNATAPLSKNKKATMNIDITQEGNGIAIKNGQTAVVTYVGKLENGTIFDASKNHGDGTFAFIVGAGQVIKGWDQGVLGMQVGESRTLTIPSDLAYGPSGIPGVIPPNATLIFDVSLVAIK